MPVTLPLVESSSRDNIMVAGAQWNIFPENFGAVGERVKYWVKWVG